MDCKSASSPPPRSIRAWSLALLVRGFQAEPTSLTVFTSALLEELFTGDTSTFPPARPFACQTNEDEAAKLNVRRAFPLSGKLKSKLLVLEVEGHSAQALHTRLSSPSPSTYHLEAGTDVQVVFPKLFEIQIGRSMVS
ncbi:hypothetical protein AVEN_156786-1 [Araneus ventricosus]|uniref:Uncharacterized protein n=1 Tax=Araneus ventricosus TaxID=182803 RepID=A0A4Y2U3A9_ARAVE|nr:hypothetical protein AVEN_156786-1 [Araneus ventricosus]